MIAHDHHILPPPDRPRSSPRPQAGDRTSEDPAGAQHSIQPSGGGGVVGGGGWCICLLSPVYSAVYTQARSVTPVALPSSQSGHNNEGVNISTGY